MSLVTRKSLVAETREAMQTAIEQRDRKAVLAATSLLRQLGEERCTEQDDAAVKLLAELDAIPTALYRHYDNTGRLLYIGVSMTITGRTARHETYAPWFREIDHIKLDWYGSRSAAMRAERHAIETEKPLHNIIHNGRSCNRASAQEPAPRTLLSAR